MYLYGEHLNEISEKELFSSLLNKEYEISHLTRELDAEVFPEAFGQDEFTAYSTSMLDFQKSQEQTIWRRYQMILQCMSIQIYCNDT